MANSQIPSGPATDSHGHIARDPTENVKNIIKSEVRRLDDLRASELKAIREQSHSEIKGIAREIKDFKVYIKAIAKAETKRINAIRAVDVAAVAVANTAAENRATTLAGQVNAAKDAQVVSMKAETDPIRKDIGDLRQSQWTIAGGREQVVETRATSSNWAIWAGVGAAVLAIVISGFFQTVVLGVTIYFATR